MGTGSELAPSGVEADALVFRFADPEHAHDEVKVWFDVELGVELAMSRVAGGWELRIPLPDLDCLEYLFDADGELAPDPGNPDQVDGAFGPHSWLALPGYRQPGWLDAPTVPGRRTSLTVGEIDVEVWEPDEGPLPLLLVHDGAEMDRYGRVVHFAATRPPMRVALLSPGSNRDERYAANPAYAAALVDDVVPALTAAYETDRKPVLLGQSLGALAALHVGWLHPETFAGLMLQSGSFFTPVLDPQESGYPFFDQVVGFVASLHESTGLPSAFPDVTMTCGVAEENLANNRLLHHHLSALGAAATWGEVRQGHTWMCWRDTLDPHLTELLRKVWH
jgi:enterochelin esterase-like enzyme